MPKNKNNSNVLNIQKYFLLIAVVALLIMLFVFMGPFLTNMLFAGIIVTAIYPLHKLLNQKIHIPKSISALITLILVLALIVIPFTLFFFFVAGEATSAYQALSNKLTELTAGDIRLLPELVRNSIVGEWINGLSQYSPFSTADVFSAIRDSIGTISSALLSQTTNILKAVPVAIIHVLVFVLTMYYFIKDGDDLVKYIKNLLPLSSEHRKEVLHKLKQLSYGVIYGIFGAAIVQGFLIGIAFYFAGFSNAAFWGLIAALFSPVPYVGVSVIWVPALIILVAQQQWLIAVLFLAWHAGIVSFADNIVKPYVIGSSSQIHPLAVLLVLIGGLFAIGLKGLFWGPTLLTLTLTFLHIYELEYESVLGKK